MSLPWGTGLPMIKVYSDATQTTLQRTLYLPPPDKREEVVAWKKESTFQKLVDGSNRERVLGYIPVMTLRWKHFNDLNSRGLGLGQADGNMLTLPDLVEVLALAPGRLRVCPGLSKAVRTANLSASGTGDGIVLAYQLQGIVDGRTVPARKFPAPPVLYRTDWQGTQQLCSTPRTNYLIRATDLSLWIKNGTMTVTAGATVAPDGTQTATLLSPSGGSVAYLSIIPTLGVGVQACASVFVKNINATQSLICARTAVDGGKAVINWSGSTITSVSPTNGATAAGFIPYPNGWYRVWFAFTTTEVNQTVRVYSDSGATNFQGYAWGAQLEPGSTPTPLIFTQAAAVTVTDYTINGAGLVTLASTTNPVAAQNLGTASGSTATFAVVTPNGSTPTVLNVWRTDWQGRQRMYSTARTNYMVRSQEVDQWFQTGTTVGINAWTAADGTVTGDNLIESATTGAHQAARNFDGVAGQPFTYSVFFKAGTRRYIKLALNDGTTFAAAVFDTQTGTVFSTQAGAASVVSMGGGIYRAIITGTGTTNGTGNGTIYHQMSNDGSSVSYTGDGTSYVPLWGGQLERSTTATSYIPTTTAAVTVTDWSQSASNVVFASNPVAGAVIEADYTYVGGLAKGATLQWSGSFQDVAVGFSALVTKFPDYRPVGSGIGADVQVEFTGRDILATPVLAEF